MKVIDRILMIMESKGISAYKIEKEIGIKQSSFSSWKKGAEPPANKIEELMQYLKVTPNEVYGYEKTKELLNPPQKEIISIMEDLNEKEQWKAVGIIENYRNNIRAEENNQLEISSESRTG